MTAVVMPDWSRAGRGADLERLLAGTWDVLVIGGGITGAGIALDAASRGLRVALVEKGDFASGTSSKSSKLVHGGLRYLREFQLHTTLEASREKSRLRRLAPHVVEDLPFLLPVPRRAAARPVLAAGLWLYDLAAGLPRGMVHRHLDAEGARRFCPTLDTGRISGAFLYHDAKADDCRLVLHVLKRAVTCGALALNYAAVESFERDGGRIAAARVRDVESGRAGAVTARSFVNATGVWCDEVRRQDDPRAVPLLRPSKGIHLVVPRSRLRCECALVLPSAEDRRAIFAIPWGERAIVGTTDTYYGGDLDRPRAEAGDVRYLLQLVSRHLPDAGLTEADVRSTFSGLRPLLLDARAEHPSRASREDRVEAAPSGLLTITGGKLTTYRRMAERIVNRLARRLGGSGPCVTRRLDLFAAPRNDDPLAAAYGSEAARVRELAAADPRLRRPLVEGLPNLRAEALYALRHERAVHLADILARRTRAILYAEDQGRRQAEELARSLRPETGWDVADEVRRYEAELELHAPPS